MEEKRYFQNLFDGYDGVTMLLTPEESLMPSKLIKIKDFLLKKVDELEQICQIGMMFDSHDFTIYSGYLGIIMFFLEFSKEDIAISNRNKHVIMNTIAQLNQKRISFLCGDAGPLALAIVYFANDSTFNTKVLTEQLIGLGNKKGDIPSELLFGQSGYLYALLYTKVHLGSDYVPDDIILKTVECIMETGLNAATITGNLPLVYAWREKQYIGSAHGYAGILYMLLQAKLLCPSSVSDKHLNVIVSCMDKLLDQCFTSGNIRSSYGSETDRLVHWCHGAPGVVHLYALAYKILRKPHYLEAAKRFADVIWHRGLLKKGYGLCHGVAGNGYAFLCMFQLTNDMKYLWRGIKFAEWCVDTKQSKRMCDTPDRAYSLFEGLVGTLYFLNDILKPTKAMFPAFQLVTYEI